MALRSTHLRVLAVCLVIGVAFSGVGSAGAEDNNGSVSQARKELSVAGDAEAAAQERVAELQKRVTEAQKRVAEAERQRDDALENARTASRVKDAAARKARTAVASANESDERAVSARADVMRLARDGYAGSVASMDLLLLTNFLADGSKSLGDFSQHLLATTRVQGRLLDVAEVTAKAAEKNRARADERSEERKVARSAEKDAGGALSQARREAGSTKSDLVEIRRKERSALEDAREARARYKSAQSSLKKKFLAACTSGPQLGEPVAPPTSSGSQAEIVWDVLLANGLTEEAAAGVIGNLQQESNVDPTTMQNGGPGMGLAQWSRGGRWDNGPRSLLSFAATRGIDPWAAKTQVEFMIYEMSADWFDLARFKKMTDIAEATVYFHDVFERSADSSGFVNTIRVGYALAWYAQLSGSEPASGEKTRVAPALSCPNT